MFKIRPIVPVAVSLALLVPALPALAQTNVAPPPRPVVEEQRGGLVRYIVPVIAGVAVGAVVWPMLVPAAEATAAGVAGEVTAAEGLATAAEGLATAETAAVTESVDSWTTRAWQTLSGSPAVVGGAIGGLVAAVLTH